MSSGLSTSAPTPGPSGSVTGVECSDENIAVTVTMDSETVTVGGPVEFLMKIENTGSEACIRDVGPLNNAFDVTSGGFDVWSSNDCGDVGDSQVEQIPPGEAFAVKGTWDTQVTSNGCSNTSAAEPGAYEVVAVNGDVESEPLTFALS